MKHLLDFPENLILDVSQSEKLLKDMKIISKKIMEGLPKQKDDEIKQIISNYYGDYWDKAIALNSKKDMHHSDSIWTMTKILRLREEMLLLMVQCFTFLDNRTREKAVKKITKKVVKKKSNSK